MILTEEEPFGLAELEHEGGIAEHESKSEDRGGIAEHEHEGGIAEHGSKTEDKIGIAAKTTAPTTSETKETEAPAAKSAAKAAQKKGGNNKNGSEEVPSENSIATINFTRTHKHINRPTSKRKTKAKYKKCGGSGKHKIWQQGRKCGGSGKHYECGRRKRGGARSWRCVYVSSSSPSPQLQS